MAKLFVNKSRLKRTFSSSDKRKRGKNGTHFILVNKTFILNIMLGSNLQVTLFCSLSIGRKASQASKRYHNVSCWETRSLFSVQFLPKGKCHSFFSHILYFTSFFKMYFLQMFMTKKSKYLHERQHTGERPFKCHMCSAVS